MELSEIKTIDELRYFIDLENEESNFTLTTPFDETVEYPLEEYFGYYVANKYMSNLQSFDSVVEIFNRTASIVGRLFDGHLRINEPWGIECTNLSEFWSQTIEFNKQICCAGFLDSWEEAHQLYFT